MAQEKNSVLRVLVPVAMVLVVLGVGAAVFTNTSRQKSTKGSTGAITPSVLSGAAAAPASGKPVEQPEMVAAHAQPSATGAAKPAAAPLAGPLRAAVWTQADAGGALLPLGDLRGTKEGGQYALLVEFSPVGAGIAAVRLADHVDSIGKERKPEVLQRAEAHEVPLTDGSTLERTLVPMALLGVEVDGQFVNLATPPATLPGAGGADGVASEARVWKQVGPGSFEAVILDANGAEVGVVKRRYTLGPGAYDVAAEQGFTNTSGRAVSVRWHQLGPVDLPMGVIRYGGDVRRVRLGHLSPRAIDPDQQVVLGDTRFLIPHATALGDAGLDPARNEWVFAGKALWPDEEAVKEGLSLSWAALTNRYFAVAVHPLPGRAAARTDTPGKSVPDKRFNLAQSVERVVLCKADAGADSAGALAASIMALKLTGPAVEVAAGATADASVGLYAGPISKRYLEADGETRAMGLAELVVFTFGGPCGFCTFQPIAHLLRWYLGVLHDYVLFDWALAIIVLVLTVRTLLHPVTRWSQTSLARFGKQMAALAPKQAKIKEKYGNEPAKMREEMARLMKEENINYAGALGCLPMLLQTPVWIALYAMIFFTFELRHEGAFFGVFQALGHPTFLGDLSEPDRFIPLGVSWHVPLLSTLMGPIDAFNLLPLILGVVFFIQQKYLTPPTTAALTPEQESQQRMMKVITVVMFPLMMYNAPGALSLYFMTNSTLGILESRWIRAGIERADKEREARGETAGGGGVGGRQGVRVKPRQGEAGKPMGFMERVRVALEEKQKEIERQRRKKN